jgi:NADH:ubiquinone oxidoreductase subunit 2 (subunit N)
MVTSMMSGVFLALILALNSALSLGYYVPVISTLLFSSGESGVCPVHLKPIPSGAIAAVVFLAIVTVYFGLFPESFDWISHASEQLFTWGVA